MEASYLFDMLGGKFIRSFYANYFPDKTGEEAEFITIEGQPERRGFVAPVYLADPAPT